MAEQDVDPVYGLGQECFGGDDAKPHKVWSREEVTRHLASCPVLCYVAEADGKVVAFALGNLSFDILEDAGHLEWVAVAPEHRRRGLATRLSQQLVEVWQDLGKAVVVADVATANRPFLDVVGKLGFQEGMAVTFCWKELRP